MTAKGGEALTIGLSADARLGAGIAEDEQSVYSGLGRTDHAALELATYQTEATPPNEGVATKSGCRYNER